MKICFWMTSVFSLGGTKRVVTDIANGLISVGHDVTIMTHENRIVENRFLYGLRPEVKVDFINIHDYIDNHTNTIPTILRKSVLKLNAKTGFLNKPCCSEFLARAILPKKSRVRLAEYINSKQYDVVIATARMALWLAIIAPKLSCKTMGWQHSTFDGYLNMKGSIFENQSALLQRFVPKLNGYIVLNVYDQKLYKENLAIDTIVRMNPCSMSANEVSDQSQKRFLMMNRLVHAKGIDMAIDAFHQFSQWDDEWVLDIVGDGPLHSQLKKKIKSYGLEDRIHLCGFTATPKKYYLQSSILLMPSRWEGWGMSVVEGNICGLTTIAFRSGALDLVVKDNVTGLVIDAFDITKFAEAMLNLAHDKSLRLQLAANALQEAKRYDLSYIVQEWNEMLANL